MRYTAALISVADIRVSQAFYEELFGLELDHDYGINVSFTCGLALQQNFAWLAGVPEDSVVKRSHNMELCFETKDFDSFLKKLDSRPDIRRLGDVVEHGWGQRVARLYDPDGHLIEVGENMGIVVRRFLASGMTMEEVSVRMDVSVEDLGKLLTAE
ncbi:VOC family protein [uncultured Oscillibacter sp.]|uniref:VOC family protein n=1 Tax=uncultured Oscillibacter sp. TaxID=876091 RepID=UPI0025DCDEA9|nr:VOC family protein [uncultured Oscillibacter sp.]